MVWQVFEGNEQHDVIEKPERGLGMRVMAVSCSVQASSRQQIPKAIAKISLSLLRYSTSST